VGLSGPISLAELPSAPEQAFKFAEKTADIALTKWRFLFGGAFVVLSVILFLAGHYKPIADNFVPSFTDRSWTLTKLLFFLGCAFSGREVIESVVQGFKTVRS
jgi:hypothetical protein